MSEFEDLCEAYGLSAGDPDATDKILDQIYHENEYYTTDTKPQKLVTKTKHLEVIDLNDIDEEIRFGNFYIFNDKVIEIKNNDFFLRIIRMWQDLEENEIYEDIEKEMSQIEGNEEGFIKIASVIYKEDGEIIANTINFKSEKIKEIK